MRVKFYGQNFFLSGHQTQKSPYLPPCYLPLSVSLFSSSDMHQSQYLDGCQAIGIELFFYWGFFNLSFFIYFIPLKKIIFIITIFTVIIPHLYPLFCYKSIGNILQVRKVISHCLITYLLRFKVVWNKFYVVWIIFNGTITHFFCIKIIRYKYHEV